MSGERISGFEAAAAGKREFDPERADRELGFTAHPAVVKCQHCGQYTSCADHHWQGDAAVRLRALLSRARTEMFHMLDCANKEEVPHDGDDFHETLQEIERELGGTL